MASPKEHYTNGVLQGSVLPPTLFNLFMHDIPSPTELNTHSISCADNRTMVSRHPKHETTALQLQDYIHTLEQWLTNNRMKVSTNKSSLTLITPHTAKYRTQPQPTLTNTPFPVTHSTKILGVTFDRGMTFKQQIDNINTKAKNRVKVIRFITHTTYAHSKEDITTIYKQ